MNRNRQSGVHNAFLRVSASPRLRVKLFVLITVCIPAVAGAVPLGYTKSTITLDASPTGLAYAPDGTLYAFENLPFVPSSPTVRPATIRVIKPNLTFDASLTATSLDPDNFFVGGMTFDGANDRLLITDNAGAGSLYALTRSGVQSTIITGIPSIAGVAVRKTGEIFVSTAPFSDNAGKVYLIDPSGPTATPVLSGLDFGAGLAFNAAGDLIVQDSDFSTFTGRLQRLPIDDSGPTLSFGVPELFKSGLAASYGLAIDSEGDYFISGSGDLLEIKGGPLTVSSFDSNGNPFEFSTAIAFSPGSNPFEPYAGAGARLAYTADFGDSFVTLVEPVPEPSTVMLAAMGVVLIGAWHARRRDKLR